MKIKFLTGLTCLLLLSSFAMPVIACPPPDCDDCYYWDGDDCVPYGDCWGGCPDCESCVYCWCEWQCGVGGNCCDGSCCYNACCNNVCCMYDEICCSNGCQWPCVEEDDETSCSAVNNMSCTACVGILGDCSDYVTMQYTNAVRWDCTGGCPGDCDYVAPPICYRTYECKNGIYYRFAECRGPIPPAPPGPLDCYGGDMPWGCTTCVPNFNALKYTGYTTSSRCQ